MKIQTTTVWADGLFPGRERCGTQVTLWWSCLWAQQWTRRLILSFCVALAVAGSPSLALAFGWEPGPPNVSQSTSSASTPAPAGSENTFGWEPGPPNRTMEETSASWLDRLLRTWLESLVAENRP